MCVALLLLKKSSFVCGEKNRARRRTKNFVFFVFFVFFCFFHEERELFFFVSFFLLCFISSRASLFHITRESTSLLCDFKRNSRSLLRYTHTERERVIE